VRALNAGMNFVNSRAQGSSERRLESNPRYRENLLLATMPDAERRRLLAVCEPVDLRYGAVLCRQRTRIRHVYFPTGSVISLLSQVDGRPGLEVGLVGAEGAVGVALALGVSTAPVSLVVQGSGSALRIEAARFGAELNASAALRDAISRYLYVFISQLAAMVPCARFHMVEARLARWLLMTRDRAASDDFYLTQEFIAYMLGVRRVGVTRAARVLRARRLVSYSRGYINILDVRGLEAASCSCYAAGRDTYARLMRPGSKLPRLKLPTLNFLRIPS
jgi:CRP-like cAMP-binding protein